MIAKKSNRSYSIEPREAKSFQNAGYDIYDDDGSFIAYGVGKTISMEKHMAVIHENQRLKEQLAAMAEKLEKKKGK